MNPIIDPLIGLADEVMQLVNTEVVRANVQDLKKTRLDLQAELDRGYDSDDAKIESLMEQIVIKAEAVTNEVALYRAKGPSSSVATSVAAPAPASGPSK